MGVRAFLQLKKCRNNEGPFRPFPSCVFLNVQHNVSMCLYLHKQDVIHTAPPQTKEPLFNSLEEELRNIFSRERKGGNPLAVGNELQSYTDHQKVYVCACRGGRVSTVLPLWKLSDLGYAHIFVEVFKHIDHSLQQVGHLTILPLSGHGSEIKNKQKNTLC